MLVCLFRLVDIIFTALLDRVSRTGSSADNLQAADLLKLKAPLNSNYRFLWINENQLTAILTLYFKLTMPQGKLSASIL